MAAPAQYRDRMTVIVALDTGWMFGTASGGVAPVPVTLPHTVTPLSWQNWKPASWERTWLYTNAFDAPAGSSGMRVFLDFAGAMTHSTVTLNNATVADFLGGYLPFSGEVTRHLRPSGNQLSVLLDSRFNLNVPPGRPAPSVSKDVDFWQPGGIYRGVRLRIVPQVFIADVFARPGQGQRLACRRSGHGGRRHPPGRGRHGQGGTAGRDARGAAQPPPGSRSPRPAAR